MEDASMSAIVGVMGGGSITALLAHYVIKKTLGDLYEVIKKIDEMRERIHEIEKAMAAMFVRLNQLAEHEMTLREHAKQLAFYEGTLDGRPRQTH